jgi:hypothetical protein
LCVTYVSAAMRVSSFTKDRRGQPPRSGSDGTIVK